MVDVSHKTLEYDLEDEDILYFLHIPKTAGLTFISILDQYFEPDSILHIQSWVNLLDNMPKDFSRYKFVRGHFGYGVYRILPKKPVYITMLREPIETTISDYEHVKRHYIIPATPYLTGRNEEVYRGESLVELLKDPYKQWRFTNPATRHLALEYVPKHVLMERFEFKKIADMDPYSMQYIYHGLSDEELLEIAKKHLSEFAFVGITEKFEESLFLLWYTFGWKPIYDYSNQNVAPSRPHKQNLSFDTIEAIKDATKLDSELYVFARQLFENRYLHMIEDLKSKYYEPKFENMPFRDMMYELLEKHYNKRGFKKEEIKDIKLTSKRITFKHGWSGLEVMEDLGIKFMWTGPDTTSTIDLPLSQECDFIIRFRVINCLAPDILESLRLEFYGQPIDIHISSRNEFSTIFEAFIHKSHFLNKKNHTALAFQVNRTIKPPIIDPSSVDHRSLGVAIDRITIITS